MIISQKKFRPLSDLNLIDDFLFYEVLNLGAESQWFCKVLVERLTGEKYKSVEIIGKRSVQGAGTDKRGIEIDVYVDAVKETKDEVHEIYDIEPNSYQMTSEYFAKRVRYYHSLIDSKILERGKAFKDLKNVIVIMILPYDQFGFNRMKYTLATRCIEEPELEYDDGARTIVFYTKGIPSEADGKTLRDMLSFMEDSSLSVAGSDEDLQRMSDMVETVKSKEDVGVRYMTWKEKIYFERRDAVAEAIAESNRVIEEQKMQLSEQKMQLSEQKMQLSEKDAQLAEKDSRIAELEMLLTEK